MSGGRQRADRAPETGEPVDRIEAAGDAAVGFGIGGATAQASGSEGAAAAPRREAIAAWLVGAAALAWLAVVAAAGIGTARDGLGLATLARGVAVACGPLSLLAMLLLFRRREGSGEAARFVETARAVRSETLALDTVLGLASRRLGEDREAVAAEAARLVEVAEESSARLREATDALAARTRELDQAAGVARVEMGVLVGDIPVAEAQVRALGQELRDTGLAAHERASALEAALAGMAARGREAEEANAGAANRLAAQAARIASASEAAARGVGEAEARMAAGIDGVLARVGQAVERTHAGIVAQGEAIDAMVARAAAAAEGASRQAGETIGGRIATLHAEIDALGQLIVQNDGAGIATIERIRQGLGAVEARFVELDETGRARTERLGEALGLLWTHAERMMAALNGGGAATTTLIERAETLRGGVAACLADLDRALPEAFDRLDARISQSAPAIGRIGETIDGAARAIGDALGGDAAERLAAARAEAAALDEAVAGIGREAARIADGVTPKLVEALVRVRETGAQAAERARDALAAIVPGSVAAIDAAVGDAVATQVARVTAAGDRAAAQAGEAAGRIEAELRRIEAAGAAAGAAIAEGETLSRQTAQLVDALNSTAIDLTRLIDADPGDAAWSAYLGGDRGVFTRRAVRLLSGGEAKAIAARYGEDETLRDQVNRYVRDFETLLRPILSMRDGSTLGVVLLSSEMGRLYVALAQAIERLRA